LANKQERQGIREDEMIAEARLDVQSKDEKDEAVARIVALVAKIENDARRQPSKVPAWWELGQALVNLDCLLPKKYHLAHGHSNYNQAYNIYYRFPSLDRAKAFKGSLNSLLRSLRKGIKGREAATPIEKAARALIKAAGGDPYAAAQYFIGDHCDLDKVHKWLHESEANGQPTKRDEMKGVYEGGERQS